MNKKFNFKTLVLNLFLCGLFLTNLTSHAQTISENYIDGQIWFQLKSNYAVQKNLTKDGEVKEDLNNLKLSSMPFLRSVFTSHSVKRLVQPFPKASDELKRTYRLEFTDINNVDEVIRELNASGAVNYAEKIPLAKTTLTPNDTYHNSSIMWHLFQINAEQAWNVSTGSSSIVVAITDNAIDITHEDLSGSLWVNTGEIPNNGQDDDGNGYIDDVNGFDVGDNDGDPNPLNNSWTHGTHVAGISGATTNNATGVSSIGFGISIMAVKSTQNSYGSNSVSNGYDGIYYAALNGADIINCSWGAAGSSNTTAINLLNWATAQGSIVVAAAGNDGNDNDAIPFYPANYSTTVSVASTTTGDVKSSFSNYGATTIDISAPGSNIASTYPFDDYQYESGTSMASPLVSGLLGLMKSLNPNLPNSDLLNCLYTTADNINSQNPSYSGELGAGRINALAAMNCVASTLSNAPVADFSANFTTITAGGSVTFTDQSTFGPTSWSWNFDNQSLGGVTPATANTQGPHVVTYSTPGFYEVSLTVSNANGNDTETKTAYIEVTTPSACNELNLDDNTFSSTTSIHNGWTPTYYNAGPGNGYVSGSNVYGDNAKAEYFPASMVGSNTQFVEGVYVWFIRGYSASPTTTIDINVWDATGGAPTNTVLGTRTVQMGDIANTGGVYYYKFSSPVPLPTSSEIAVGIDFSNLVIANGDTAVVVTNTIGETSNSVGYERNGTTWSTYNAGWGASLNNYIFPQLTESPSNANLSASSIVVCEGDQVVYDATGSTFQDTLLWTFENQTNSYSNNIVDSLIYGNSGNYKTYLEVIGGGCGTYSIDSVTITVNAAPTPIITSSNDTICNGDNLTLNANGGGTYFWSPGGQTSATINVSPTNNTTYNVDVTTGGCLGSTSKTIYVESQPTAAATFTPSSAICVGDDVNFDGAISTDANSYSWLFPDGTPSNSSSNSPFPIISFGTGGTHNYSLEVSNSCGNNTFNGTVTINALPNIIASATPGTTICQGDAVTISAAGASTYNWDNGLGTGQSHSVSPSSTTVYNVTGDDGTCTNTDAITITVSVCTGIEESITNGFRVFPNPTTNIITIEGLENIEAITLLDVTGKIVYTNNKINQTNLTIDLSDVSNGLYFMQVKYQSSIESFKIVKQ